METRKNHLRDTKTGNAACAGRRTGWGTEYITAPYAEFTASANKCERCATSKLFSFLSRVAAK